MTYLLGNAVAPFILTIQDYVLPTSAHSVGHFNGGNVRLLSSSDSNSL